MSAIVIHCTCPDAAIADRIASALVEERLAACVQQVPGLRSTYMWEGRLERADEILLLIKTVHARLDDVVRRVQALHPYDVPELLAVESRGGSPAYLDWVSAQSRTE